MTARDLSRIRKVAGFPWLFSERVRHALPFLLHKIIADKTEPPHRVIAATYILVKMAGVDMELERLDFPA